MRFVIDRQSSVKLSTAIRYLIKSVLPVSNNPIWYYEKKSSGIQSYFARVAYSGQVVLFVAEL